MLIQEISVRNFRCILDVTVSCENLTVFLGQNGSGKSTLLKALDYFYDIKAPIAGDDFFNRDTGLVIEIRVVFASLNDQEINEFSSYVQDGKLAVTKRILIEDEKLQQRYYAAFQQIPVLAEIKQLRTVTEKRDSWNALVDSQELPDIGPRSTRGDVPDDLISDYESRHPELCTWVEKEVQFIGPKNIGGGSLDKYSKFVFVPAVKDVMDEVAEKRGTPMYQLLDMIVIRRFQARDDVKQLQADFEERIKEVYSPAKMTELSALAEDITKTLQVFVPNAALGLTASEPSLPTLPTPSPVPTLIEDEFEGAIDRKGHGLQRALIFSLLQHIAITKPVDTEEDETSGPDLIFAIEEPELYQHPLRARHLSNVLMKMTQEGGIGLGGNNQVFYTTHSPYFVDLGRFSNLRIIRKSALDQGDVPCSTVSQYTLVEAAQEMARITERPPEEFTSDTFHARAYPVMTHLTNEGFFASVVVIVEGITEVAAIVTVSELLQRDWLSKGIAVISIDGKNKIDRPVVIFRGFGIPTYFIFDGDMKHDGANLDLRRKTIDDNQLLLRLANAEIVEFPETTVSEQYACFQDDFEEYCKTIIGDDAFIGMRDQVAQEYGYDKPSHGLKNYEVVAEVVTRLYSQGHRLPAIENIVEQVEALA